MISSEDCAAVLNAAKRRLQKFTTVRSGARFRAHYDRLQQRPHLMRTLIVIGLGLLLIALGLALLVLPGPGLLIGFVGAALIAGESRWAARLLDRMDLCLTRAYSRWRR
jgi:putative transmembrane protein PGPGW